MTVFFLLSFFFFCGIYICYNFFEGLIGRYLLSAASFCRLEVTLSNSSVPLTSVKMCGLMMGMWMSVWVEAEQESGIMPPAVLIILKMPLTVSC